MELNEARKILKNCGYLLEDVKEKAIEILSYPNASQSSMKYAYNTLFGDIEGEFLDGGNFYSKDQDYTYIDIKYPLKNEKYTSYYNDNKTIKVTKDKNETIIRLIFDCNSDIDIEEYRKELVEEISNI